MNNLGKRLEDARAEVRGSWSEERARRVERSLLRRQRRRSVLQTAGAFGLLLGLLFVARALFPIAASRWEGPAAHPLAVQKPVEPRPVAEPSSSPVFRLRDGSLIRLLDSTSRVEELPAVAAPGGPRVVALELKQGGARFDVVRDPSRLFRVHAGRVTTEVLGTEFTVERLAERTRVAVLRGRVRVLWPSGHRELGAGESGLFPPELEPAEATYRPLRGASSAATAQAPRPPIDAAAAAPHARSAQPLEPSLSADWMGLAQEGQFDSAYAALMQLGVAAIKGPMQLLLAADVARLSRHPKDAVAPLRRVLREHASDPRAPLAAFTLGRALLDELGQPREAAEAFREAQDLDPEGPLAADALTREVEAWSRAGEAMRARERALLYLQRYPDGDRQRSVRRYGGLD